MPKLQHPVRPSDFRGVIWLLREVIRLKQPIQSCDICVNYEYDAEMEDYACVIDMDEDESMRLFSDREYSCPYFRPGNEYTIVHKQI